MLGLSLIACATKKTKTAEPAPHIVSVDWNATIETLLREEFDRPQDATIKMKLARAYWCSGARGLAVEHWKWVETRTPRGTEAESARERLATALRSPTRLETDLSCHQ
ncbi:MAG: hypothetical protein EBX52_14390 [Proteobacteria bacterium]|nr:hypothetical protein [Pseudomonadota bacterium]